MFKPLGMTDTGFWVRPDQRDRLTTAYQPAAGGGLTAIEIEPEAPFTERPALLEGAVGLVSTVPDYLAILPDAAEPGRVGRRSHSQREDGGHDDRQQPVRRGARAAGGRRGWGLGNVDVALDTGEYGWDGTAGTIFTIDPRRELITVLMWQTVPADPDRLRARFKTLVDRAIVD